jgi:cytochrome bd ubiquinol oxidase subunit II
MALHDVPLLFALAGLVLYVVLGGADFGAGIWQLVAGRGEMGARERDLSHDAMGPVWEANHVWLIFVLTVFWTAYPVAFGSIASTLCVALFIAGIGIIARGAAYALRSGTTSMREQRVIDTMSAVSSILTPFALGAAVGGIASRRVPVGNAEGDLISSWLNATSIAIGVIAVASAAYIAAIFLSADALRVGEPDLSERFRRKALGSGVVAGLLAVAGLVVLHEDAHPLYRGLVTGDGLAALIVSAVAGLATLGLVAARRYTPARYTGAIAVAAVVAGWALAQRPVLLPGLTIEQAAAGHDTLVAVVIAVVGGGALVFPSLALLFRLTLTGRLGYLAPGEEAAALQPRDLLAASVPGLLARAAGACFLAGIGFLTIAETGWAHGIGVAALLAWIVLGVVPALPPDVSPVSRPSAPGGSQ